MKQFNRMFIVGSKHNHEDRVTKSTTSTNIPPPTVYGLRKDKKRTRRAEESEGPPVLPVCGARKAPNSRLENFLSRIIRNFRDNDGIDPECKYS